MLKRVVRTPTLGHRTAESLGMLWLVGPAKMASDFRLRKPSGFIHWGVNNLLQTALTALVGYDKNKNLKKTGSWEGDGGRNTGEWI